MNEWRRDFGEEAKGHGALAARTAGEISLKNSLGVQSVSQKRGHSADRLKYTLTSPKPSAREAGPLQTSSYLIFKIQSNFVYKSLRENRIGDT